MKKAFVVALALVFVAGLAFAQEEAKKDKPKAQLEGKINITNATAEQFALLPGVGEKTAQAIIEQRTKEPFKAVEDIKKVKGVGDAIFANIQPYLTMEGETTLKKAEGPKRERKEGGKKQKKDK